MALLVWSCQRSPRVCPRTCRQRGDGGIWRLGHQALQRRLREPSPGELARVGWGAGSGLTPRVSDSRGCPWPPRDPGEESRVAARGHSRAAQSRCGLRAWTLALPGAVPSTRPGSERARQATDQSRRLVFIGSPPRPVGNQLGSLSKVRGFRISCLGRDGFVGRGPAPPERTVRTTTHTCERDLGLRPAPGSVMAYSPAAAKPAGKPP